MLGSLYATYRPKNVLNLQNLDLHDTSLQPLLYQWELKFAATNGCIPRQLIVVF